MSLTRTAIAGGLWMAGINAVIFIFSFAGNILLARLLSPTDFGIIALALSISEALFMLGGFGLAKGCIHLQGEPAVFETGMSLAWILTAILIILGILLSTSLSWFYQPDIIKFFIILCCARAFDFPLSVYSAYLEKDFRFGKIAVITGRATLAALAAGLLLAYLGFGAWSLLLRTVLTTMLTLIGMIIATTCRFPFSFHRQTAAKLWHYSSRMFFLRISEVGFSQLPKLFLGSFGGSWLLGLYERSYFLSMLPNRAFSPFNMKVAFALYASIRDEKKRIENGVRWNLLVTCRLMLPVGMVVFLFSGPIVVTLYGEKWLAAGPLLQGLALYITCLPIWAVLKHLLLAQGYISTVTQGQMASLVPIFVWGGLGFMDTEYWKYISWAVSLGSLSGTVWLAGSLRHHDTHINWWSIMVSPAGIVICLGIFSHIMLKMLINPLLVITSYSLLWLLLTTLFEHKILITLYHHIRPYYNQMNTTLR